MVTWTKCQCTNCSFMKCNKSQHHWCVKKETSNADEGHKHSERCNTITNHNARERETKICIILRRGGRDQEMILVPRNKWKGWRLNVPNEWRWRWRFRYRYHLVLLGMCYGKRLDAGDSKHVTLDLSPQLLLWIMMKSILIK